MPLLQLLQQQLLQQQPRHRALHQSPTGDVTRWATPICAHLHKGIDLEEVANRKAERSDVAKALFVRLNGFKASAARPTFDDQYGIGRMRRPQGGGPDAQHRQPPASAVVGWIGHVRSLLLRGVCMLCFKPLHR